MASLTTRLKNALRPFKRIRNEIGNVRSEIAKTRDEIILNIGLDIRNILAYHILCDSGVAHKEAHLMALYPKNGGKVSVTSDFATMKRYLNAVRPVRVKNLVRVGGENDGGYVMINPKIDLLLGNSPCGNSPLDKHSADLQNFGTSQTSSLVSVPKFCKNNESHTENPSVVLDSNKFADSSQDYGANPVVSMDFTRGIKCESMQDSIHDSPPPSHKALFTR